MADFAKHQLIIADAKRLGDWRNEMHDKSNPMDAIGKFFNESKQKIGIRGCWSYEHGRRSSKLVAVRILMMATLEHPEDGETLLYFYNHQPAIRNKPEINELTCSWHPYSEPFGNWVNQLIDWDYSPLPNKKKTSPWAWSDKPVNFFTHSSDKNSESYFGNGALSKDDASVLTFVSRMHGMILGSNPSNIPGWVSDKVVETFNRRLTAYIYQLIKEKY